MGTRAQKCYLSDVSSFLTDCDSDTQYARRDRRPLYQNESDALYTFFARYSIVHYKENAIF